MSYLTWPLLLLAFGLILLITEAFMPSGGLIGLLALGVVMDLWNLHWLPLAAAFVEHVRG